MTRTLSSGLLFALLFAFCRAIPLPASVNFDSGESVDLVQLVCSQAEASPDHRLAILREVVRPRNRHQELELAQLAQDIMHLRQHVCDTDKKSRAAHLRAPQMQQKPRPPLVIVPGLTVPELNVVRSGTHQEPHFYCRHHNKKPELIWFGTDALVPGLRDCFVHDMAVTTDGDKFVNSSDAHVSVRDFGDITTVEQWKIMGKSVPIYLDFVNNMTEAGWVPGKTLLTAQYDFRLGATYLSEHNEFGQRMRNLVESAHNSTGLKVHILGHSYGSAVSHRFLRSMPQAWKDTYVASYLSLCGPYLGSPEAFGAALSGFDEQTHGFGVTPTEIRDLARSVPVVPFLFPHSQVYNPNTTEIVVQTPDKNFSWTDAPALLSSLGLDHLNDWVKMQATGAEDIAAPGVPVHCINGYGVDTPLTFVYNTSDISNTQTDTFIYGDGDGVVPRASLNVCQTWKNQQSQPVTSREVEGLQHGFSLFTMEGIDYIIGLIGTA